MGDEEMVANGLAALFSALIVVGVVVIQYDLRNVSHRIAKRRNRIAYLGMMSAFLALVGAGEGYRLFRMFLPNPDVPSTAELLTNGAMAMLACWSMIVRPLRWSAILCPYKEQCPVVRAEMVGRLDLDRDKVKIGLPTVTRDG